MVEIAWLYPIISRPQLRRFKQQRGDLNGLGLGLSESLGSSVALESFVARGSDVCVFLLMSYACAEMTQRLPSLDQ